MNPGRRSVDQYHDMIRHGILMEGDNVELLDGQLVAKPKSSPVHSVARLLIWDALTKVIPKAWLVDSQVAITLSTSEPEPDVIVVRGEIREYLDHHPRPEDISLVVEVSDDSLTDDQGIKKTIYVEAGLPVYWIFNLVNRRVEVYTDPTGPDDLPDYRQRQEFLEADQVPVVVAGRELRSIAVSEPLP